MSKVTKYCCIAMLIATSAVLVRKIQTSEIISKDRKTENIPEIPPEITDGDCKIDIQVNTKSKQSPLVLSSNYEFLYPKDPKNRAISFRKGKKIYIGCPGGDLSQIVNSTFTDALPEGFYECVQETTFTSPYFAPVDFNKVTCSASKGTIRNVIQIRRSSAKCLDDYVELKIGYNIDKGFVTILTICFDNIGKIPKYSKIIITKNINNGYFIENDRPNFFDLDKYYDNINLNKLYKYEQEKQSIKDIRMTLDGIEISSNKNWNKGHLAANGDFVYRFQKYATFDYVNVAPQWSEFNGGNWNILEKAIRNFVAMTYQDVTVYTGTLEISTLLSSSGMLEETYLKDRSGNITNRIPVPKWFWKYIHVKKSDVKKFDYVFLGFNNPYSPDAPDEEFRKLCNNKTEVTEILNMPDYVSNKYKGILFACKKQFIVKDSELYNIVFNLPSSAVKNNDCMFLLVFFVSMKVFDIIRKM